MSKSKRRQSTPTPSSMSKEITDDDIYAAFGIKSNTPSNELKLDDSNTPRRRSKKKAVKRQSAPVKRLSVYDILYEDEDQYEIPKGVFDAESPPTNEKKLKRPKTTGKPVSAKILTLDQEPSIFDLLVSPREHRDMYALKMMEVKRKELVADLGKPNLDDDEKEASHEHCSEKLPILEDTSVAVRPISMTKRNKKTKKVKSTSLLIDLGEPPRTVAECPETFSASDSQLFLKDEYLDIKSGISTPRESKKTKKIKSKSLLIDLGEPPVEVSKISESRYIVPTLDNETLDIRPSSVTKRGKKAQKITSKSLVMDLSTTIVEDAELSKKSTKSKSKSLTMDHGIPIVERENKELLNASDIVVPLIDGSSDEKKSKRESMKKKSRREEATRDGMDQEILPSRRCRSHSPHARKSFVHWGQNELHVIEDSSKESDDDRWASHSDLDSPPHVPRKQRKRHKSCAPPLARSPNRLWLASFEVPLGEKKTKKEKKKRKSKEKSVEKSPDTCKKSVAKLELDSGTVDLDKTQKPITRTSLDSNASSKDSKKESPKKKRKSIKKESIKTSVPSSDSSMDDSIEKPSSKQSLNSNGSSKKESPKKKRKSSRKSTSTLDSSLNDSMEFIDLMVSKVDPSLHGSMEIVAAVASKVDPSLHESMEFVGAVEEAMRATEQAKQKRDRELARLQAEKEARRQAEQDAAAARLRLKVVEVQRKVEEEDKLRATRKAEKQAIEGAQMRTQEEARLNSEMEEERHRLRAEQELLQKEMAEVKRLRKAEEERLEKERAELQRQMEEETKRLAQKRSELERRRLEEEERLQREKEEHEQHLCEEKARILQEQEAVKARLNAEKQELERMAKEEKLQFKADKQERDRLAKEEKARIKAEKDAELARIKTEKEAEKARIMVKKEAERVKIQHEKDERARMAEEEKARVEAEKRAEMKRQEDAAEQKTEKAKPLKLKKPSLAERNFSIDSLLQGSIDSSIHAEVEAERMIKDRQQLEREKANLERVKTAAAERLKRRAEAIRAAVNAEKEKSLDAEMHDTRKISEEMDRTSHRNENGSPEKRERAPSPPIEEEAEQRAKKEAWTRKQEKRRRMEEKACEDYRLGKLDGRRSITKNDRQFGSSWNKVLIS